ncbi:MAG: DUF3486 family protein [Xanthomonadaceae bacterium]|nr:DUF3486 family protein [Xanthomonadaceae bacterium]
MPKRSKVLGLPKGVKAWLDKSLVENGFSEFRALSDELRARGYEISKSAINDYSQPFRRKLEAVALATEQARAVVESSPDDEDAMGQGLMRLVQEKLFTILVEMDVDVGKLNLSSLTKAIAQLGRTSILQKRHAMQAREKALNEAADTVAETARAQGMGEEQVRFWREKVLGLK